MKLPGRKELFQQVFWFKNYPEFWNILEVINTILKHFKPPQISIYPFIFIFP